MNLLLREIIKMIDILSLHPQTKIENLLDGKGSIEIIEVSPRLVPEGRNAEVLPILAARVSYGVYDLKSIEQDKLLINYLIKHSHTSPLEFASVTFRVKAPIFAAREWFRHRTGKYNEYSQRYSPAEEGNYYDLLQDPEAMRIQSTINKQSSETCGNSETEDKIKELLQRSNECIGELYSIYAKLTSDELKYARELARCILPVSGYTTFYCQFDLNNLLKFITLRADDTAQREIRVYAKAMIELCRPLFCNVFGTFEDKLDGISLTSSEIEAISSGKYEEGIKSKSGKEELKNKIKRLNIQKED